MNIEKIKEIVQSCHINFMIGSGLSCPFLSSLGNVEQWLTELYQSEYKGTAAKAIEVNILAKYYEGVMWPCINTLKEEEKEHVITYYSTFLSLWNSIMARRHTPLLDKQINIFTTNIDNLLELAAEQVGIEFNMGFRGLQQPKFDENSFSNIVSKVSPLFHTKASIPAFNYLKVHGSINWKVSVDKLNITYDASCQTLQQLSSDLKMLKEKHLLLPFKDYSDLYTKISANKKYIGHQSRIIDRFLNSYSNLVMINPTKSKFRETVLDLHFYELMRLYSNALERINTILFVAGFSFADEHITKITLRAANSNPTLQVIIFAYDENAGKAIESNLRKCGTLINDNVLILTPDKFKATQKEEYKEDFYELCKFDLRSINKFVFEKLSAMIL